jgi:hypothetical protein
MTQHVFTDALGRSKPCIHRYGRRLAGISHPNKLGRDRMSLVQTLEVGTQLVLVPEPNNPLDRDAILIYREGDLENDLGYLDSNGAKLFCKMIERGATYSAEVNWINKDNPQFFDVHIYVFHLNEPVLGRRPARDDAIRYSRGSSLLKEPEQTNAEISHEQIPSGQSGWLHRAIQVWKRWTSANHSAS